MLSEFSLVGQQFIDVFINNFSMAISIYFVTATEAFFLKVERTRNNNYLVNFLYFTRVGFTLSGPKRRILSAS